MTSKYLIGGLLLLLACNIGVAQAADEPAKKRPNILMIAVDDLRTELGCYGADHIHSPNIDRLAAEGSVFLRSNTMVAVCGASRASLMTGLRPAYTRFRGYQCYAMKDAPDAVPMNTYFKSQGYTVLNNGKMYHHAEDHNDGWSEPAWRPKGVGPGFASALNPENQRLQRETGNSRGLPYESADVPDNAYRDGKTADKSIDDLRRLAADDKPFFLAVGFVKPHLPFNAPKKYWDLYDPADIELPENYEYTPKDAPKESIHTWGELRSYINVPKKGPLTEEMARGMIHGYYACVSYTDAHVGRLLDEIESLGIEDDTIVVLWGDHGWNLGEHTMWCKHCVYENSMKAPLLVKAPGMPAGQEVTSLVQFIDIYPTLCDLTGVEHPSHLDGRSLVPLLEDGDADWEQVIVGRYGIGETIRTDRYRYSEFLDKQGNVLGRMLYDHETDPRENVNIAELPENAELVKELSRELNARKGK